MQEFSKEALDIDIETNIDSILDTFLYEEEYNRIIRKIFSNLNIDWAKQCDAQDSCLEIIAGQIENYIRESVCKYDRFKILKTLVFLYEQSFVYRLKKDINDFDTTIDELKSLICKGTKKGMNDIQVQELTEVLCITSSYVILKTNIASKMYIEGYHSIWNYLTESYDIKNNMQYYNAWNEMMKGDKPEDIEKISPKAKKFLEAYENNDKKALSCIYPDRIRREVLRGLNWGFLYDDILKFEKYLERNIRNNKMVKILSMEQLKDEIPDIEKDNIVMLVNFFSFGNVVEKDRKYYELRTIYKHDEMVILPMLSALQCIAIMKNLILSSHFSDVYNISDTRILDKAQQSMSKFLGYKIADILEQNGFLLPHDKCGNIRANIIYHSPNLDKNGINDIDVIALKNEILYNIEVKYSKADVRGNFYRGKNVPRKYIDEVKNHYEQIAKVKEEIVAELFPKQNCTRIVNIIITARANKEVAERIRKEDIILLTYQSFVQNIDTIETLINM